LTEFLTTDSYTDHDRKAAIRTFVLTELPAELRLRIFGHLLLVPGRLYQIETKKSLRKKSTTIEVEYDARRVVMEKGNFLWPCKPTHLQLLQTCRQLRKEGRHFFYNENHFEVIIELYSDNGKVDIAEEIPATLHVQSIRSLRVCVDVFGISDVSGIDWSVLGRFVNLEVLQVAIGSFPRHNSDWQWTSDGTSEEWKESIIVNGLIKQIVENVSKSLELNWERGKCLH
jgi:hypothetical protein